MKRSRSENLTQTLTRLSSTYSKVNKKSTTTKKGKDKKSHSNSNDSTIVRLTYNDNDIDPNTMTLNDMKSGMKIVLTDTFEFVVIVNPPFINSLSVFPKYTTINTTTTTITITITTTSTTTIITTTSTTTSIITTTMIITTNIYEGQMY